MVTGICGSYPQEKIVKPTGLISTDCISNRGCNFFKCFENRFPCGQGYWIVDFGQKYCRKTEALYSSFTMEARAIINATNACQINFLQAQYSNDRPMRCKRFYDRAFEAVGKCYDIVSKKFCKVFPQNRKQFLSIFDVKDLQNSMLMSMIRSRLSKCKPPIDIFSLLMSLGSS